MLVYSRSLQSDNMNSAPSGYKQCSSSVSHTGQCSQTHKGPLPSSKEYLPPYEHKKIFPDRVLCPSSAKFLECSICYHLFDKPITLSCGHSFCFDCFKKRTLVSKVCPDISCVAYISDVSAVKQNIALANMIDSLVVSCPSHKHDTKKTCQKGVKIKDLQKHWKSCPHILFKCKCEEFIISGSFLESDTRCKCPEVKCRNCGNLFQERLFKYHSDDCMQLGIKCKSCGLIDSPKSRETHQKSRCFSFCPYKDYGCFYTNTMDQEELKNHCQKYKIVHDFLLLTTIDPKIASSFYSKTYELIERNPDSESIFINIDTGGWTIRFFCKIHQRIGDLLPRMISQLGLDTSVDLVDIRLKGDDKNGILSLDRTLADYNIQFGQTLKFCVAENFNDEEEDEDKKEYEDNEDEEEYEEEDEDDKGEEDGTETAK